MKDVGTSYTDTDGNVWAYVDAADYIPNENYWLDFWGSCTLYEAFIRGETKKNGCYWGGCNASLGRNCSNWRTAGAISVDTRYAQLYTPK